MLLPENISVFAFDFSGAGLSDGDYLSLGYYEKADVSTVVDYLKASQAAAALHPCPPPLSARCTAASPPSMLLLYAA